MNTLLDEKIIAMAAKQAKQEKLHEQDQLAMVTTMFEHLANKPKLDWLAMQYIAHVETVFCDMDRKSSDYLSCVMDELSIYASENGFTCDPSYDIEKGLEELLEDTQNTYDFEIGRARNKTRKDFLSLLEHELATDVS